MKSLKLQLTILGRRKAIFLILAVFLILSSCVSKPQVGHYKMLVPQPNEAVFFGSFYTLPNYMEIFINSDESEKNALYLMDTLKQSTGRDFNISGSISRDTVFQLIIDKNAGIGNNEGYRLSVNETGVKITAESGEGLFYGCQTLLQLFPPNIYSSKVIRTAFWVVPYAEISDKPRFEWRGAMLDVARHFFQVEDVKRYIDLLAYHKLNKLHLHLSDDQGFRLMIDSWPMLALIGGSTQAGGKGGGHYTKQQYLEIVEYAADRYITIIPEIDMPGHTNAILASYAELNCSNIRPELYEGYEVGFSSLCINNELTYEFLDDVIREIAELTPGPYIHIGGDEVYSLEDEEYSYFIYRVQEIVLKHGEKLIGWEEINKADMDESSVIQFWKHKEYAHTAVQNGNKLIISLAEYTYLDMKYSSLTELGQQWAGTIDLQKAYSLIDIINGFYDEEVYGIEAPLWTEFIYSIKDIEYMAFPRLAAYAELAWSSKENINWDSFKRRLAGHGKRLDVLSVNYFKSPLISWDLLALDSR